MDVKVIMNMVTHAQCRKYLPQTFEWKLQLAFLELPRQKKPVKVLGVSYCQILWSLRWRVLQPNFWKLVSSLTKLRKWQSKDLLETYQWRGCNLRPVRICIISNLPVAEWRRISFAPASSIILWKTLQGCFNAVFRLSIFIKENHSSFGF